MYRKKSFLSNSPEVIYIIQTRTKIGFQFDPKGRVLNHNHNHTVCLEVHLLSWMHMWRLPALRDIIPNEYTYPQLCLLTSSSPATPNTNIQKEWLGPLIDYSVNSAPWSCTEPWSSFGPSSTKKFRVVITFQAERGPDRYPRAYMLKGGRT